MTVTVAPFPSVAVYTVGLNCTGTIYKKQKYVEMIKIHNIYCAVGLPVSSVMVTRASGPISMVIRVGSQVMVALKVSFPSQAVSLLVDTGRVTFILPA